MVMTLPSLVSWHRCSVSRLSSLWKQKQKKRNVIIGLFLIFDGVLLYGCTRLARTGNYQIYEFDWLKSILTAVLIFPSRLASRPVTFCSEHVANLTTKILTKY